MQTKSRVRGLPIKRRRSRYRDSGIRSGHRTDDMDLDRLIKRLGFGINLSGASLRGALINANLEGALNL